MDRKTCRVHTKQTLQWYGIKDEIANQMLKRFVVHVVEFNKNGIYTWPLYKPLSQNDLPNLEILLVAKRQMFYKPLCGFIWADGKSGTLIENAWGQIYPTGHPHHLDNKVLWALEETQPSSYTDKISLLSTERTSDDNTKSSTTSDRKKRRKKEPTLPPCYAMAYGSVLDSHVFPMNRLEEFVMSPAKQRKGPPPICASISSLTTYDFTLNSMLRFSVGIHIGEKHNPSILWKAAKLFLLKQVALPSPANFMTLLSRIQWVDSLPPDHFNNNTIIGDRWISCSLDDFLKSTLSPWMLGKRFLWMHNKRCYIRHSVVINPESISWNGSFITTVIHNHMIDICRNPGISDFISSVSSPSSDYSETEKYCHLMVKGASKKRQIVTSVSKGLLENAPPCVHDVLKLPLKNDRRFQLARVIAAVAHAKKIPIEDFAKGIIDEVRVSPINKDRVTDMIRELRASEKNPVDTRPCVTRQIQSSTTHLGCPFGGTASLCLQSRTLVPGAKLDPEKMTISDVILYTTTK